MFRLPHFLNVRKKITSNCLISCPKISFCLRFIGTQLQEDEVKSVYGTVDQLRRSLDKDISNKQTVPLFKKALLYGSNIAIKDHAGEYTYEQIFCSSQRLAIQVSNICGSGARRHIACFCPNNVLSIITMWACWMSGQIIVPLDAYCPEILLNQVLHDSRSFMILTSVDLEKTVKSKIRGLRTVMMAVDHSFLISRKSLCSTNSCQILKLSDNILVAGTLSNEFYTTADALILYSGFSTNHPQGIVYTHKNLDMQMSSLANKWNIKEEDCFFHTLPIHCIDGCISGLMCPLSVGAKIIMRNQDNVMQILKCLACETASNKNNTGIFMGSSALFTKFCDEFTKHFISNLKVQKLLKNFCLKKMRLITLEWENSSSTGASQFFDIFGQKILEYYCKAETGIALSNFTSLPNVEAHVMDEKKNIILIQNCEHQASLEKAHTEIPSYFGELEISGPGIFEKYLDEEEKTNEKRPSRFKTGDNVFVKNGIFHILGNFWDAVNLLAFKEFKFVHADDPGVLHTEVLQFNETQHIYLICYPYFKSQKNYGETWSKKDLTVVPVNNTGKINSHYIIKKLL